MVDPGKRLIDMDVVASIELKVGSFMEGGDNGSLKDGCSTAYGEEFLFWEKSFSGILFTYDHINATKDAEK